MMPAINNVYDDTANLLRHLDERQLRAVRSIIIELSEKNDSWQSPLGIENEKQLWDHIDQSLEHAKIGVGRDSDDVISDFRREFAL